MPENKKEDLLNDLLAEQRIETTMIEFYQALLDTDLKECFPEREYKLFKDHCEILFKDSERHKEEVGIIIKKHQK